MQTITIPKTCKAGFQTRKDTYSGKLAYVIYYDEKGVLRKEQSWSSWRNNALEALDFDNVPTKGFFINKEAGGYRSGWDYRQTYCRIYDPRGFEFEITIPNLIYILKNVVSNKDKGFDGEFVYGWDGKDLVLVPVEAPEYQQIKQNTAAVYEQGNIGAKDLVVGHTYANLEGTQFVYLAKDYKYTYSQVYSSFRSYFNTSIGNYSVEGMTQQEYNQLPFSLERPEERIQITKSSKKYYWFYNKNINQVVAFSSLDKKLYYTIEDKPTKDLSTYIEMLNKNKEFSKIRYDKDKLVYMTLTEFIEKITEQKTEYEYYYLTKSFSDDKGKRYYIRTYKDHYEVDKLRDKKFSYDDITAIKNLFEQIMPLKSVIRTLENGCVYEHLLY